MTDVAPNKEPQAPAEPTPRTDAAAMYGYFDNQAGANVEGWYVEACDMAALERDLSAAKAELQSSERERLGWYNAASQGRADAARYRYVRANPAMLLHLKNSEFDAAIDRALKGVADAQGAGE